ncbi:MAG TPA: hypothetical protein VN663_20840 [Ramlibacter sp.]|nr:hypothetical protein [Ramlibacter sp.]
MVSVVVVSVVVVVVVEPPLAPIVLPPLLGVELLLVLESVLEPPAAVLGLVELLPLAAAGVLDVPLSPIGVDCVLCWPALVAGSLEVLGGVLCAIAAMATAAKPASRPLNGVDAVISETP